MRGQHNGRAIARDNTGQNTDKRHMSSSRIEIKLSDRVGNRSRTAELEGMGSTDHATATNCT